LGTDYQNALQKASVFILGSDVDNHRIILCGSQSQVVKYNSLADFYLTGRYYDANDNLCYEDLSTARKWSWELLGHAAHLLTDMCLPAHVHNDTHWPDIDLYSCKSF
jgi:hypothetical protein